MLQHLSDLCAEFQKIRDLARAINQHMVAYLVEMGIEECQDKLDGLKRYPRH